MKKLYYMKMVCALALIVAEGGAWASAPDLETKDAAGNTQIMRLIGSVDVYSPIKHLLIQGVRLDVQNNNGHTPLMLAVIANDQPVIDLLLHQVGKNLLVDAVDKQGKTALFMAVEKKSVRSIEKLCRYGANPDIKAPAIPADVRYITPLMRAVQLGWLAGVQALVEGGAQVNAMDDRGATALFYAVFNLNNDFVGSYKENFAIIDYLVKMKIRTAMPDNTGLTAYDYLLKNGYVSAVNKQGMPIFEYKRPAHPGSASVETVIVICEQAQQFCIGNQCVYGCTVVKETIKK